MKKILLRKTTAILCVLAAILGIAPIAGLPAAARAQSQGEGYLPKAAAAEKVLVLDLSKDLAARDGEAKEAYMAITAIQGLVNRDSAIKVYLTHTPQEHDWTPFAADEAWLSDGLIPVPREYPIVNNSRKYPVLSYLLDNYSSYIKGKVYTPNLSGAIVDCAVMAAITACGVEDAIPVTAAIGRYIELEGYDFTAKADTRSFSDNISAFNWAYDNYFTRTTRDFVGAHSYTAFGGGTNDQFPIMYDYYIANRAFVFCLDANDQAERARIRQFLSTADYPAGTAVLGLPVDEGQGITAMEESGYFLSIMYVPNLTVTSSFALEDIDIEEPPIPTAVKNIDNNTAYIAFYATDGDSMGFPTNFMYQKITTTTYRGDVPIGWSINPQLLDLFPTLFGYYSKLNYGGFYQYVGNMNNGGSPSTADSAAAAAYREKYQYYADNCNNMLRAINYFGSSAAGRTALVKQLNPYLLIQGYQGSTNGNDVTWSVLDDTDIVVTGLSGGTQGNANTNALVSAIERVGSRKAAGQPAFTIICAGDGRHSGDNVTSIRNAINTVYGRNPSVNYVFLTPVDLAATWRVYQGIDAPNTGDDPPMLRKPDASMTPTSVEINPKEISLVAGDTYLAKARVLDAAGQLIFGSSITWSSLNTTIATVNTSGTITARAAGIVDIIATAAGGVSEKITVNVVGRVATSVGSNLDRISIRAGSSAQLSASLYDQFGKQLTNNSYTWTSLNTGIATVNSSGLVLAVSPGVATIRIAAQGCTKDVIVTVLDSADSIARVLVEPKYLTMYVSDVFAVTSLAFDSSGREIIGFDPAWTVADGSVAEMDSSVGYIKAKSPGMTTLKAYFAEGVEEEISVYVMEDNRQKVDLSGIKMSTGNNESGDRIGDVPVVGGNVNFEQGFGGYPPAGDIPGNTIGMYSSSIGEKAVIFSFNTILKSVKAYNPTGGDIRITVGWLGGGGEGDVIQTVKAGKSLTIKTGWSQPHASFVLKMDYRLRVGDIVYGAADPVPTEIRLNVAGGSLEVEEGGVIPLKAQVLDQNGNEIKNQPFVWSSDNSANVSVTQNGLVTGVKEGTSTYINVRSGQLSRAILVTVVENTIGSIIVTPGVLEMYVHDIFPVTAKAFSLDQTELTGRSPVWLSENESIATVDEDGYIHGLKRGLTTVKAYIGGYYGEVRVIVKENGPSRNRITFEGININEQYITIPGLVTFESYFWIVRGTAPLVLGNTIALLDSQTREKAFTFTSPVLFKSVKVHNPTNSPLELFFKRLDGVADTRPQTVQPGKTATILTGYTTKSNWYAIYTDYRLRIGEFVYGDDSSVQEIADGIMWVKPPERDETQLTLPDVPAGYTIRIKSSTNEGVIATDAGINPPAGVTTVGLVFTVTRTGTGETADTAILYVDVPAKTPMTGKVKTEGDIKFDSDSIANTDSNQWRWLSYPGSRMVVNPGIRPALGANMALKVGLFVDGVRNITSSANATICSVQMGNTGGTAANSTGRTTAWYPYKLTTNAVFANSVNINMTEYFANKDVFVRVMDVSGAAGREMTLASGSTTISGLVWSLQPGGSVLGTHSNYYLAFRILLLNADGTVKSTVTPTISGSGSANSYSVKIPFTDPTAKVAFILTTAPRLASLPAADVLARLTDVAGGNFNTSLRNTKAFWDGKLRKVPAPTVWGIQAGMDPKGVTPEQHRRAFYAAWTFSYQNIIEPTPERNYPYYQVGLGKASMWNGGHSSSPNSCAWESMFEIEQLAMVEPEIAWSAAEGFIKSIADDGTLAGECLPSQKAHMVWTCYDNLPNETKLAELYPKLRAYLIWRGNNPRWIMGSSHNYAGEKDISFVSEWYSDVNYAIKICEVLGYTDDIAMWEARKVQMTEDSRAWFFTPQAGDPNDKIYNTYFTNTGLHYNSARPTDVDNYILSALFISDFPDDMVKKLVDHYIKIHDPEKDLVGLDFFKYGDGCHIAYGLIDKSGRYPYLEDMYKEFINANIRTVVKVVEFCEESRPDNYATQGTCPTSFGASTLIDFTYINNGVRIDSGHIAEIVIPEDPQADPIYISGVKFKMDGEYITHVDKGEVSLEVTVKAFKDVTFAINPIIAVYASSGKLLEVADSPREITLRKGESIVLETPNITIPEDGYKHDVIVKGFVWDGNWVPMKSVTQLKDWTPPNLALEQPITSSSVQYSNGNYYYAEYAVDGIPGTRWAPAGTTNEWICVDLGAVMEISRVVIMWESAYGRSYRIDVSATGTNNADFTTAFETTAGSGGTETRRFTPVNARYVRLYCRTSSNSSWGASVYEFEIYPE